MFILSEKYESMHVYKTTSTVNILRVYTDLWFYIFVMKFRLRSYVKCSSKVSVVHVKDKIH